MQKQKQSFELPCVSMPFSIISEAGIVTCENNSPAVLKRRCHSREAQIEPPLIERVCVSLCTTGTGICLGLKKSRYSIFCKEEFCAIITKCACGNKLDLSCNEVIERALNTVNV